MICVLYDCSNNAGDNDSPHPPMHVFVVATTISQRLLMQKGE